MKINYSANNSGGHWWLKDGDWKKLEKAGWDVEWVSEKKKGAIFGPDKDGRWLGVLATDASKEFETPTDAMREFEEITGQSVMDEGCNCCGPPHSFQWGEGKSWDYASGEECARFLFGENTNINLRSALEELEDLKASSSKWKKLKD